MKRTAKQGRCPLSITFLCLVTAVLPRAFSQERATWVQFGPDRTLLARTVSESYKACPNLVLDGRPSPMQARRPVPPGFPMLCEATIPPGTRSARIDQQPLALPASSLKRIVVMGDTGCRVRVVKHGQPSEDFEIQDCDQGWQFKALADAAATRKPDLVIHTGDYVYRESPCPAGKPCQGPSGFQWKTWYADFFQPASSLLKAAPWIFVRGNHEDCEHGAAGWFYLLDPRSQRPDSCASEYSDPYAVSAGDLQFLVLDSSVAEELDTKKRQVLEFVRQFRDLDTRKLRGAWLLSHQPLWAFRREAGESKRHELDSVNDTLQRAWREAPIADVGLVLSGHIHIFQVLSFADGRPPQVVVGNSGTELARRIQGPFQARKISRTTVAESAVVRRHGFGVFERQGAGWSLQLHSLKRIELSCTLTGAILTCAE